MKEATFLREYHSIIEHILSYSSITIFADDEDANYIIGYCVHSNPNIIHWIYVRSELRLTGNAKMLFRHIFPYNQEVVSTHLGHCCKNKNLMKEYNIQYNPLSLLYTSKRKSQCQIT
jgi:hypothetical protein